jgi:hypothetical protein
MTTPPSPPPPPGSKPAKLAIVPPKFSGIIDEDAYQYLQQFDLAASSNLWNDAYKTSQLPNYLANTAQKWFLHWKRERAAAQATAHAAGGPAPTPISWTELTTAFQLAFRNVASKDVAEEKLLARRHKIGETPEDYIYSMLELIHNYDNSMDEATKVRYIIKGLRPSFLKEINPLGLTTVTDVLQKIRKIAETQYLIDHREEVNNATTHNALTSLVDKIAEGFNSQQQFFSNLLVPKPILRSKNSKNEQTQYHPSPVRSQNVNQHPNNNPNFASFNNQQTYRAPDPNFPNPAPAMQQFPDFQTPRMQPFSDVQHPRMQQFQDFQNPRMQQWQQPNQPPYNQPPYNQTFCAYCKQPGHFRLQCPVRPPQFCHNCGQNTHSTTYCRFPKNEQPRGSNPRTPRVQFLVPPQAPTSPQPNRKLASPIPQNP